MQNNPAPAGAAASLPARSASNIEALGVVVLAHNHAQEIAGCIAAIFASNSHSGWRNSLWIVVVADSCTDDTARVAREALGAFGRVLEIGAFSSQAAHQVGVSAVMEHFGSVPRHALLLTSTEAAAALPRDWIDRQLKCSHAPMAVASADCRHSSSAPRLD